MKRAIFLDIDGTLIDCMEGMLDITQNVKESLRKVQANGDYVFLATGRPYALLSDDMLNFGFDGFILANGAHIIINNETIYSEPIKKDFVQILSKEVESNNIQYILQGDKYSYLKECSHDFYTYYDKIGVSRKYLKSDYDINNIDVHKIEMLCPDDKSLEICIDLAKSSEEYDYFSSINKRAIELYLKKNSKGSAILRAIEHINVSLENTYAFGDGKNDIEMLSTVKCGIAMGNASDEVKKYANEITESVQQDGVAIGIEKYIYI